MEFLRRTLEQIKKQLGALTFSQKTVIGLLGVLMVIAFAWMSNYSSLQEKMPLLNQSFTEEVQGKIIQKLDSIDEPYEIKDNRIMVLRKNQKKLLATLWYEELLPEDTSMGWQSLLSDSSPWSTTQARDQQYIITLQMELARTIKNFPGVDKAEVFINKGDKRRLNNTTPEASASVSIEMAGNSTANRKKLATSIAALVCSANNRMKRENINVLIDGDLVPVVAQGQEFSTEYIEQLGQWEKIFRDKIAEVMPASSKIQVALKLQTTNTVSDTTKYLPDGKGTYTAVIQKNVDETKSERSDESNEPGAVANVGTGGGGGTNKNTDTTENTEIQMDPYVGVDKIHTITPEGGVKIEESTATILIPWMVFENIAREKSGDNSKKPDDAAVRAVMATEMPRYKQIALGAFGLAGKSIVKDNKDVTFEKNVVVDYFWPDAIASWSANDESKAAQANAAAGGLTIASVFTQYGRQIGISALAMVSMLMALMVMRKGVGPVEMSDEEAVAMMSGQNPLDALSVEEANLAGDDSDNLLAGMELEEGAVKAQQILEQIRSMVSSSPDDAAKLISKWLKQDA